MKNSSEWQGGRQDGTGGCGCRRCQGWVTLLASRSGWLVEEELGKEAEKVGGSPEGVVASKRRGVESCRDLEKKREKCLLNLARWKFCGAPRGAASWWSGIRIEWGLRRS